jgi:hypothetical protein
VVIKVQEVSLHAGHQAPLDFLRVQSERGPPLRWWHRQLNQDIQHQAAETRGSYQGTSGYCQWIDS